ncbi:sensor histidine kinase [Reichenbachiella ulvae]|uniref:histidine kinase n=1 Tax=Reichenbachiella ulvae TaxID=2980104 RepID=A0ABT3CSS5_9BACT|nr:PAS domain-containing sensor histidine kinase [Reichenbachiella ulvae]MCV9386733.1 PAS domain-containing sensor histidine kinase [Reichenbachiella ulvae]
MAEQHELKHLINQINLSNDRLWSYDRDLKCTVVNERMSLDYKIAFGEALKPGMHLLKNVPEPLYSQWLHRYQLAFEGEVQVFVDTFQIEGVPTHVQVTIVPIIEEGEVIGAACTSHDITEQRNAELQVLQNQAYLTAQIENTSSSIWSVDRNYKLLIANSVMTNSFEHLFGARLYPGVDILESFSVRPKEERDNWKKRYDRALKGERFTVKDDFDFGGEFLYTETSFNPIEIEGEIVGVACFGRNITDSVLAEMALKKEIEIKNKFFSIVAHDLKGPAGNIIELVKILNSKALKLSDDQRQEILGHLATASEDVYELLDKLLAWALSQQNMLAIDKETLDVRDVVEESIKAYRPSADSKIITTKIKIKEGLKVFVDKRAFSSTIANLYNNAIKFTREMGEITISAIEESDHFLLTVKDNGVGMEEETASRIFDEASMMSNPGTKQEKGTGLGLILCQEFVKLNGGEIWVKSEQGKGSEFNFTIPKI